MMKIKRLLQLMVEDISGLTLQIPLVASHEEKNKKLLSFMYTTQIVSKGLFKS